MSNQPPSPPDSPTQQRKSPARRILKWTGITLGSLVALLVIAVLVIPHLVNLGPVKHEIEHVASQSTGRKVTIDGPLSLSLFPWVGFGAENVTMSNAPGFGDKPFMQVKEADIHVQLIPLIFHSVKVSGITLDHLTLNLERNAKGTSNWQDLAGTSQVGTRQQQQEAPSDKTNLAHLSVGRVALNDMSLNYDDAKADTHYTLSGINLQANDIASGHPFPLRFHVVFNSRQPHVNVTLDLDTQVQFDAALEHIELNQGTLSTRISGGGLSGTLDAETRWQKIGLDPKAGNAKLQQLQTTVAGTTMHLDAEAQGLRTQPVINGHLSIAPFSPRKLLATLGDPIPDNLQGLDRASLDTDLHSAGKGVSLDHLQLKIDNSILTGKFAVPDFSRQALRFDLTLDTIDLNHYLPAGSGPAEHAAVTHSKKFMETRLPGRLLSKLDMAGQLHIGGLSGFGLNATGITLNLNAANGVVTLDPLAATLYGGSYGGSIKLARAGQGISLTTSQKLTHVDAGKVITALGGGSRLSGTADALIKLQGQGDTVAELFDTLKGNATFSIQHGALEGINLWDSLERAYALVKDHKRLPASGPKRTEFANFKGAASIAHGVINNDALEADLPFIALTGSGKVNLVKHYLDYDLLAKVVKTPKTANADLSQLKGMTVPMHVSGDFSNISSVPDIKKALEARAKAAVQKKLDEQKKSARDKLKKKLQDLLNGGGGG